MNNTLSFMVIGDWGYNSKRQKQVAEAMNHWAEHNHAGFVITTGDNFYPYGVTSSSDRKFNSLWKKIYHHRHLHNLTWYVTLGNHDYGEHLQDGREVNQVLYGAGERRWCLPAINYAVYKHTPTFQVHFIMFDTESFHKTDELRQNQLTFLGDQLQKSNSKWKFVVGHGNPYGVGDNPPMDTMIQKHVVPLLESYGAQFLFSGHDHSLQHLHKRGGRVEYIVSGGGGKEHSEYSAGAHGILNKLDVELKHQVMENGFVGVIVTKNETNVQFVRYDQRIPYNFTKQLN